MKKGPIARIPIQMERVDGPAAKEIWESISIAIDDIYNKNVSHYKFEVLHRSAYKLVVHRHGDFLYNETCASIMKHLRIFSGEIIGAPQEALLALVSERYTDHCMCTTRIKEILLYLERNYILLHKRLPIYDMGLALFRDTIVGNGIIRSRFGTELLRLISQDREGFLVERDTIKSVLTMLLELSPGGQNVYEDVFERPFLDESRTYYRCSIERSIADGTAIACLHKINRIINSEIRNFGHYVPKATENKLMLIANTELIERNAEVLVAIERSGVEHMIRDEKFDDLKLMYDIFSRVPSTLDHIRTCLGEYVSSSGTSILSDISSTKDPLRFVSESLSLKSKVSELIERCFGNDTKFQKMVFQCFDEFMNRDQAATVYLAVYTDEQLRNGFRGANDKDIDVKLDQIIVLLRHIKDKDVFESYCKTHLGKRLLEQKSISEDIEKSFISKLKAEYGFQFTSKLERMFNDMYISRADLLQYKTELTQLPVDCDFTVLTNGFWSLQSYDDSTCIPKLHVVLKQCLENFAAYYLGKHNKRRLTWQFSLGFADVRLTLGTGKIHDITVSTYQMMILALFNREDSMTLNQIAAEVPIPESHLKRHLLSLCINPSLKILNRKILQTGDVFTFNETFSSKFRRIKVPLIKTIISKDPSNKTGADVLSEEADSAVARIIPADVQEDRNHMIDSVIVRIMKARKLLAHNDLFAEVSRQLNNRFQVIPTALKIRIESLIEREYIRRDVSERNVYHYMA